MNENKILTGSIYRTLLILVLPQIGGFFAITAFNFADSWFVSQLDKTLPANAESLYLSSISLTFPVVFGIGCIAIGIGIAITTLVSRAIARGENELVRRIVRDGFLLTITITAIITVAGILSIDSLFTVLGAKPEQLPLLREYMTVWYGGSIFMLLPMAGNNALRGSGDTFWPGVVMVSGAVLNVVLDPILIFGNFGLPALGMSGAAWATVIARSFTALVCFTIIFRKKLISLARPRLHEFIGECRTMFSYAFPAMFTKMVMPFTVCVYNLMAVRYGKNAVAALNIGVRVEQFALLFVVALAVVLMIFLSQNLAAGYAGRARRALNFCYKTVFVFSLVCYFFLYIIARPLAEWFNNIHQVQDFSVTFIHIRPLSYPLIAMSFLCQHGYFALGKPLLAFIMEVVRLLVFGVVLAYIGGVLYGFDGMVGGIALGTCLGSLISLFVFELSFRKHPKVMAMPTNITEAL